MQSKWRRYEELRPDELVTYREAVPVVFWPLGLIEHHGWHLPVGLDGLKAERLCIRVAEHTGGVLLPTLWWGGGGGHGDFLWTHYQPLEAAEAILVNTLKQLIAFNFRVMVLLAGHYPWENMILEKHLPEFEAMYPNVLFLWGTEMDIGRELKLPGDHAAREETSYGLHLLPEFVDMDALHPGRDNSAWPNGRSPDPTTQHPGVCFDPRSPQFAQMGDDAGTASAARGEAAITRLVEHLAAIIQAHLSATGCDNA